MKTYLYLIITIAFLDLQTTGAQNIQDSVKLTGQSADEEYKTLLSDTYAEFDSAKSLMDMLSASNRFGLIAKKYTGEWSANFYASYCLAVLSYIEKDETKRDAYLDEADKLYEKATELIGNENDEIYVLGALLANARIAVKPMARYQHFGEIFNTDLDKARALRPENPRIYYVQATSVYYTPKAFGGGAKNAIGLLEKADGYFQTEQHTDIMKPYWGKKQNTDLLNKCNKDLEGN